MSMSTHVVAIKPPDEKWKKMKAAWDACTTAGIPIPDKLYDFFGDTSPDEKGVVIDGNPKWSSRYSAEGEDGIEVDLTKLPEGITIIRFVNSY